MFFLRNVHIGIVLLVLFSGSGLRAQWTAANSGLSGGSIQRLAMVDRDLFALHLYGGVYASSDGGQSWSDRNASSLNSSWMFDMQSAHGKLYVLHRFGVFVSTNRGLTWQQQLEAPCDGVLGIHAQYVYASTLEGLKLSADSGATWFPLDVDAGRINALSFRDSVVYVGSEFGCYVSYDNGRNWSTTSSGFESGDSAVSSLCVHKGEVYAGSEKGHIYRLDTTNNSWVSVNQGLGPNSLRVNCLKSNGTDLYCGTYDGCYVFAAQNSSWQKCSQSLRYRAVSDIIFRDSEVFIGCLGGGVFASSDNGAHWQPRNQGLTIKSVRDIAVGSQYIYAACYGEGLYSSNDNGAQWFDVSNGLQNSYCNSVVCFDSTVVVGTANGLFVSKNNGRNWSARSLENSYVHCVRSLNGNLFAATGDGLYGSNDTAQSWVSIGFSHENVTAVGIHEIDLFCGSDAAFAPVQAAYLHYSNDYGTTWKSDSSTFLDMSVNVLCFKSDTLYLGTSRGLYSSVDTGRSFTLLSTSLLDVNSIVIRDTMLFVSGGSILSREFNRFADNLAFASSDGGHTWIDIRHNLDIERIMCLAVHDDYLFCGVLGGGVYRMPLSSVSGVDQADNGLRTVDLLCAPNPVDAQLHVELLDYARPSGSATSLEISNMLGQELYSVQIHSDTKSVLVSTAQWPNGPYVLSVRSDNTVRTRLFIVHH